MCPFGPAVSLGKIGYLCFLGTVTIIYWFFFGSIGFSKRKQASDSYVGIQHNL